MASSAECSILPALHQRSVNRVGKAKNNNRFKWEAANVTSKCVFDCVWVPLCMEMPPAEQFHITCFMHGSPTGTYIQRKRSKHVLPRARALTDGHMHIGRETSCRLRASRMAATDVLAVAGADGGGSCGDGLVALTPIFAAEIKSEKGERKKKRHKPDGCCHPLQ